MTRAAPATPERNGSEMEVIEHHLPQRVPRVDTPGHWDRLLESALHRPGVARGILLGSLLITAAAWWAARHFALDDAHQRFERRADEVHGRMERRMASYEAVLRGGVALLAAQPDLTREGWRRYVESVQPERYYPGIQGFGVTRLLQPQEVATHEAVVRAEGFPNFSVRPPGDRPQYTAITYLEPLEGRNLRAFGYDMLSEPVRREAMLRARDSGNIAMSGIVTLVQEDGHQVQKGLLMYLPVYRDASGARAGPPQPAQLWGWVYAPFRVNDLMAGILGEDGAGLDLQIHDAAEEPLGPAFFTTAAAAIPEQAQASAEGTDGPAETAGRMQTRRRLDFGGRSWTLVYAEREVSSSVDTWQSNLVALAGLSIDLLLYWSVAALSRRKQQSDHQAAELSVEAEHRLQTLHAINGLLPNAILVFSCDEHGRYRLVHTNPAFSRWFGPRPEDLLGLTEGAVDEWLDGLAHADERMPPLDASDAHIVLAGPPRRVLERRMREGDCQRIYYFHDVTQESEVERLKNEFLTTAAHELRTPLATVYGFSELLMDGRVPEPQRVKVTQMIYRQAGVLKHLVDELLDLARIDSLNGRDFVAQRCDLRSVAQHAAEGLMRPERPDRIRLMLGSKAAWAEVDPVKLEQAVTNVLSNALKYSPEDTQVTLQLVAVPGEGQVQLGLQVSDQGIGMSAEQCAQAFDRFYRADPSGHILGSGLGLSIVREIVDLLGGRVELDSRLGVGTRVTIWLPASPAEGPVASASDAAMSDTFTAA